MAYKTTNDNYTIEVISGDTHYLRLNIKDNTGALIDTTINHTGKLGIKRNQMDTEFLIPEVVATMYTYDVATQPFTIEFELSSADTMALLNYGGKERKALTCYYDVEIVNDYPNVDEVTTILSGTMEVKRSIAGAVV